MASNMEVGPIGLMSFKILSGCLELHQIYIGIANGNFYH